MKLTKNKLFALGTVMLFCFILYVFIQYRFKENNIEGNKGKGKTKPKGKKKRKQKNGGFTQIKNIVLGKILSLNSAYKENVKNIDKLRNDVKKSLECLNDYIDNGIKLQKCEEGKIGSRATVELVNDRSKKGCRLPRKLLNIKVPKGMKGDKGDTGERGNQGIPGKKGDRGQRGYTGQRACAILNRRGVFT
jgi:hypothetical protein